MRKPIEGRFIEAAFEVWAGWAKGRIPAKTRQTFDLIEETGGLIRLLSLTPLS